MANASSSAWGRAGVLDGQLHGQAKAARFPRANGDGGGDLCPRRVLLVLLANQIQGIAEAPRLARREMMLRCGGARFARTANRLRHGKLRRDAAIIFRRMAVAAACGGEQWVALIHFKTPSRIEAPSAVGDDGQGVVGRAIHKPRAPGEIYQHLLRLIYETLHAGFLEEQAG